MFSLFCWEGLRDTSHFGDGSAVEYDNGNVKGAVSHLVAAVSDDCDEYL